MLLTVHIEDGRQAQTELVHRTVWLVVLQFAEERVGVTQGLHYFLDHVALRHRTLQELGVTPDVLLAVSYKPQSD